MARPPVFPGDVEGQTENQGLDPPKPESRVPPGVLPLHLFQMPIRNVEPPDPNLFVIHHALFSVVPPFPTGPKIGDSPHHRAHPFESNRLKKSMKKNLP